MLNSENAMIVSALKKNYDAELDAVDAENTNLKDDLNSQQRYARILEEEIKKRDEIIKSLQSEGTSKNPSQQEEVEALLSKPLPKAPTTTHDIVERREAEALHERMVKYETAAPNKTLLYGVSAVIIYLAWQPLTLLLHGPLTAFLDAMK